MSVESENQCELFFVGHGSRELDYEMLGRISQYTHQLLQAQLLVMDKCVTAPPKLAFFIHYTEETP